MSLKACNCDEHGSASAICEKEGDNKGKCTCKDLFDGQICNKCKDGYYGFSQVNGIPDCQRKYYRPFTIELWQLHSSYLLGHIWISYLGVGILFFQKMLKLKSKTLKLLKNVIL